MLFLIKTMLFKIIFEKIRTFRDQTMLRVNIIIGVGI